MFYRRKIVLALLQLFDGELEKIRLQKLLFLFCLKQQKATFDFIPYKFGCFSHSATADLNILVNKEILGRSDSHFKLTEKTDYIKMLNVEDQSLLLELKKLY